MFSNITTAEIAVFVSAIMSYLACFGVVWWMVLLVVMPTNVSVSTLSESNKLKGYASSAPDNPNIKQKCIITTYISLVLATTIWALFFFDILSLEHMSDVMARILIKR